MSMMVNRDRGVLMGIVTRQEDRTVMEPDSEAAEFLCG